MFLRVVRATVSNGLKREYVRVVEACRDRAGKTQHHTVLNLGRKDLLAAHLDLTKLQRLLHGDDRSDSARREDIEAIGAWDWGPMLAARIHRWARRRGGLAARGAGAAAGDASG